MKQQDYPSIFQQAESSGWQASLFDFGKAKRQGVDYFNPSIITRKDGDWLIVRRSEFDPNASFGKNSLMAFSLTKDSHNPSLGFRIIMPGTQAEHFEDARAIQRNGITWIGACNFLVMERGRRWTGAHQVLIQVDENWKGVHRTDPVLRNNGPTLWLNTGHEKNWLWFFHGSALHVVYSAHPHVVVEFDHTLSPVNEHLTSAPHLKWQWGELRGGTPPILIDDEYWTFFHSSLEKQHHQKRRYFMGAYAFEAKPPFRMTRIVTEPLLAGSSQDRWSPHKPLVVFPCGSLLRDDKWFVVGGLNDLESFWIEIPHADIVKRAVSVLNPTPKNNFFSLAKTVTRKLLRSGSTYYHSGDLGDIVYALNAIRLHGGGTLMLGPERNGTAPCREPIDRTKFDLLKPILDQQSYINQVEFVDKYDASQFSCDLNAFRNHWKDWELRKKLDIHNLCQMHCYTLDVHKSFAPADSWMDLDKQIESDRIIVHRSRRYHSEDFPWKELVERHRSRLLFVGMPDEHEDFEKEFGRVSFWKVRDFLEMAELIAGAEAFVGNQSFPCSLALAIGQRVYQESWETSKDCLFPRPTFLTQPSSVADFEKWLC